MIKFLKKISFIKLIRMLLAVILFVQAYLTRDTLFLFLGIALILLTFLLPECGCFGSTCKTNHTSIKNFNTEEIVFEEIKEKK